MLRDIWIKTTKTFEDFRKTCKEFYEEFGFIDEEDISTEEIEEKIELREIEDLLVKCKTSTSSSSSTRIDSAWDNLPESLGTFIKSKGITLEIPMLDDEEKYHHVALTWDGRLRATQLYIDGKKINLNKGVVMNPVIYSPDAIILPDIGITKIRIEDAKGGGTLDNFPIANPDGWVIKPDSTYLNTDEFGGQKKIQSDMQLNQVALYGPYDPTKPEFKLPPFNGKPWNKLVSYVKYFAHFHKPQPNATKGWYIYIECEVNSTNEEFLSWAKTKLQAGYDDDVAAEFVSGQIIVNSKYTFAPLIEEASVGFRPSGSSGTQGVMLKLFIPLNKKAVIDRFIQDYSAWQVAPKLKQTINQQGLLEFSR